MFASDHNPDVLILIFISRDLDLDLCVAGLCSVAETIFSQSKIMVAGSINLKLAHLLQIFALRLQQSRSDRSDLGDDLLDAPVVETIASKKPKVRDSLSSSSAQISAKLEQIRCLLYQSRVISFLGDGQNASDVMDVINPRLFQLIAAICNDPTLSSLDCVAASEKPGPAAAHLPIELRSMSETNFKSLHVACTGIFRQTRFK